MLKPPDFFRQIVENGHVPMVVTGLDGTIHYVNGEFCRLTGYSAAELVGGKPSLLKSGKTPDSVYRDMWQTITHGEPWHGELINKRKNGEVYTELIYISPLKNDSGEVVGYIGIWVDISRQKVKEEEMRILSVTDPLTGLFNRRGFVTHAVQAMKVAYREQTFFQLLMIDIDGLKKINDQYGHEAGDMIIKRCADVLRSTFRDCDILARLGGDEFAAILLKAASADLPLMQERLTRKIAADNAECQRPYTLSLSVGAAAFDPKKKVFLEQLMQAADQRLYTDKSSRK
ncbi:MAG: diguanylate cyclase [Candidatus Omnitrophica bacterium]|nr:diguanylate cyclase [Candidatus Omnitrophota bacterium]